MACFRVVLRLPYTPDCGRHFAGFPFAVCQIILLFYLFFVNVKC